MPFVSVVLTTHDGRLSFLKKSIPSVLNQTFKDFELIVVDDGSNDGTDAYVKALTDPRIKYIHRDRAFGSDPRPKNDGTRAATGEYVAYLDSDNRYLPEHLAILVSEVKKDPTLDVVYGDRLVIDTMDYRPSIVGVHSDFNFGLLFQRNYIDTSDSLIRRSALIDIGGWDERYRKYVDWNMYLRLAKAGYSFKRVAKVITEYYRHKHMKSVKMHTELEKGSGMNIPAWEPLSLEIDLPYLHEPKKPRVAVFTLTKDRLEYTKVCLASLRAKAGYEFDHYIVDNGSTDGTVEWLKDNKTLQDTIINGVNTGISTASNQMLDIIMAFHLADNGDELPQYDLVVKYDNDCLSITDNWLAQIVELYNTNHMMCWSPYPEGLRDNPGGHPRSTYWKVKGHLLGVTEHLGGLCHVAPASVYKKFRWDNTQPLHGLQDLELSQWLIRNQYGMAYVEDIRVEHYEGTAGQHTRYPEYFELRKKEKMTFYEENGTQKH